MKNNKKRSQKLTLPQIIILFFVNTFYYYSIVSTVLVVLVIILVIFTKNSTPLEDITLKDMLPILLGVIIFIPIRTLQKHLMNK